MSIISQNATYGNNVSWCTDTQTGLKHYAAGHTTRGGVWWLMTVQLATDYD